MVRAAAVHQVPDPQHDEHERDQELHPEPESRWHREPEGDDCAPEEHDRQGVPEPLQDANGTAARRVFSLATMVETAATWSASVA
jgi:hypothetical protein